MELVWCIIGMIVLLQHDVGIVIKAYFYFISWVEEFLQMILPFFGLFLLHHALGSWTQTRFGTLECGKARCWGKVKRKQEEGNPTKAPPSLSFIFFSFLYIFFFPSFVLFLSLPLSISFDVNSEGFRNNNNIIATTTIINQKKFN